MQRHFSELAFPLYWNPTDNGDEVEPFDVVGAETVLFSVFVQVMPLATPDAS